MRNSGLFAALMAIMLCLVITGSLLAADVPPPQRWFVDRLDTTVQMAARPRVGPTALAAGSVALTLNGSSLWSGAHDVAAAGNYAYVAMLRGLAVLDVTDYANPVLLSTVDMNGGFGRGVAVSGDHAYVADDTGGLQIVSVADHAAPVRVASVPMPGAAYDVAVQGSYAYVAVYAPTSLQIVDISDPTAPIVVGFYDTPGPTFDGVAVVGDYAYLADGDLRIVNISNPAAPILEGTFPAGDRIVGVAAVSGYAAVADGAAGMKVIDVSTPASPTLAYSAPIPVDVTYGVAFDGDRLLATARYSGLYAFDFTDPANIVFIGFVSTPFSADRVASANGHAFVAVRFEGVTIANVTGPVAQEGIFEARGFVIGVDVRDQIAYVADGYEGLKVVDVSNPNQHKVIGEFDTPVYARTAVVSGSYAYVPDWDGGLQIVDVSNPANPVFAGSWDYPGMGLALDVAIVGNYAYVADFEYPGGVDILDISNPSTPAHVARYELPARGCGVAVAGNYLYFAASGDGLHIVDISAPSNPVFVGQYSFFGEARNVAVSGSYAYLAAGEAGLHIVDISDPSNPVLASSYDTPGYAYVVRLIGSLACVADRWGGLQIINVTNPLAPQFSGSYTRLREAFTVEVDGSHIYVGEYAEYYTSLIDFSVAGVAGDANGDGVVTASDIIYLIAYTFKGGPPPAIPALVDVDCDGLVDVVDIIYIVNYVFRGGDLPVCS